jgi:hypothetical protein
VTPLEPDAAERRGAGDELPESPMIFAQDAEELLRRGRLGECGESSEVAEQAGDVGAVPGEQALAVLARDELRNLRREKPRQLLALPPDEDS